MRRAEGGETFLTHGAPIRASIVEDALLKHDEGRPEGFSVESVVKGKSGQVTTVANEEWLLHKLGLHLRGSVLQGKREGSDRNIHTKRKAMLVSALSEYMKECSSLEGEHCDGYRCQRVEVLNVE